MSDGSACCSMAHVIVAGTVCDKISSLKGLMGNLMTRPLTYMCIQLRKSYRSVEEFNHGGIRGREIDIKVFQEVLKALSRVTKILLEIYLWGTILSKRQLLHKKVEGRSFCHFKHRHNMSMGAALMQLATW